MDLSVADVLAFESGDLVRVDVGLSETGRGFAVSEVVVVVVFVVTVLHSRKYLHKKISCDLDKAKQKQTFSELQ